MARSSNISKHYALGKQGEAYAQEYVMANGYKILHTNWRYGKKELDIVTLKDETIVVFEVKTRIDNFWEEPKDAVKIRKQKNMVEAADAYVHKFDYDLEVQFDILSLVYNGKGFDLEHIPDAFYPLI
jgi:putative endonuclease